MTKPTAIPHAKRAILTIAEIKAAAEAFDRGDVNVYDSLEEIRVAIEPHRAAASPVREVA